MSQKVSHNRENHVSLIITYYQQTDICLPKGQCIQGSGLNSFPSHSIVFLNRLFHSHKSSLKTRNKMSRIGSGKLLEKPNKMLGGNLQQTYIPCGGGEQCYFEAFPGLLKTKFSNLSLLCLDIFVVQIFSASLASHCDMTS